MRNFQRQEFGEFSQSYMYCKLLVKLLTISDSLTESSTMNINTLIECVVFGSVSGSMASMGTVNKGKVGQRAILWYTTTTVILAPFLSIVDVPS